MSDQSRQVQNGGRIHRRDRCGHARADGEIDLQRPLGAQADGHVELDLVALGVGLGVGADRLGVPGVGEREVIAEVDRRQSGQVVECLGESEPLPVQVDVAGGPGRRHAGEDAGAALEHPLRALALGEHPAQEAMEVLQVNPLVDVEGGIGGGRGLRRVLDRGLDAGGGGVGAVVSHGHHSPAAVGVAMAATSRSRSAGLRFPR